MIQLSIEEILKATNGRLLQNGKADHISSISTDSRSIGTGALFVPLIGENFDGHDYISGAFEQGAAAALTQKSSVSTGGGALIYVDNTLKALQRLAAWYRTKFSIPFAGITGSVGKTSTKDMVACALGAKYHVLKNEGNLNNEIGVPLTLFRLDESHEAAVVEMGMSGFGEISLLTSIVKPKVAIITNIGISHIEKLGSRQNILKAKLEILEGLQPGGLLIINGDDVMLNGVRGFLSQRTVSYGLEEGADYQACNVKSRGENGLDFDISIGGRDYSVVVPAPGIHNVYNALAAIAAARELGVPVEAAIDGIARFSPGKMRLNIIRVDGLKIINDAYNASPQSMKAALDVLEELEAKRRIAVLGDMLELGQWSVQAHLDTGKLAAQKELDYIVSVGTAAVDIARGAAEAGYPAERIRSCSDNAEALEFLLQVLKPGDGVLVKGSRGMKMEEIVQVLAAGK